MNDPILASLRELIDALDRRVGRTAETAIAEDAAILRRTAVRRIQAMERLPPGAANPYNQALAGAIMTDDGGNEGA